MNILHLTAHLNTGGITSYLMTLSAELIRRGHNVVIASSKGDAVVRVEAMGVTYVEANLRFKSEIHPGLWVNFFKLKEVIEKNHIQVIHAHTRSTQVIGSALSRVTGVPMVSTCHGFFKPRLHRKIFGCWGAQVIAISKPVQQHLHQDFALTDKQVQLIVNGIDLVQFPPVTKSEQLVVKKHWQMGKDPVIGLIARLSSVKGIDILIEAFHHIAAVHPTVKLLIVGHGPEEKSLREKAAHLELNHRVRFENVVAQTASILPVFDVIIAPSRMEGLGLSVMEAMASGLPVIASRVGGLIDLIQSHENGILVKPNDPEELAQAILALLNDPEQAARLGVNARQTIAQHFISVEMAEKTLKIYQKVSK